MQYFFEIYLMQNVQTAEDWQKLYNSIMQFGRWLDKFDVVFVCEENVVRFFVISNRDLGGLSNNLGGMILRPVNKEEIVEPAHRGKERFIQFHTGGNLLDLKEKYLVKRSKDLLYARFSVRAIHINKAAVKAHLLFRGTEGSWYVNNKVFTKFPAHLFAINFKDNNHYLRKTVPAYLNIEKSLHMLSSENMNGLFEVDTFPYFSKNYYLNMASYSFDQHSFIIGASGSGKSKLISLFVDRLQQTALNMNYRVVVIDPHASLVDDFQNVPNSKVFTFSDHSTELFASAGADISASTELTATLFRSLLGDQYNARLDRLLRFSLFVLFTAQAMSLDNLKRFLTEIELRNQMLDHVREYVPPNITRFFGGDFNELRTQYYNESIQPLVALVDEMQLQPAMVGKGDVSLAKTINENFLSVFSLNKVSMGEKVVKTVAGLIIQQVFLLAQARAFNEKVILIIDEVSVVQNPALASILSEARKYNLFVFLTQQYFGQVEEGLRSAIFANVNNYYVFRVSEDDARALEGNLKMELPKDISLDLVDKQFATAVREQDIRVRMLTELHPRECLVRVLANGQLNPCFKARTLDAPQPSPQDSQPISLQAYDLPSIKAPTKFVERQEPVTAQPNNNNLVPQQPSTRGYNLMELLAETSSSRLKIKKHKEHS